MCYIDTLWLLWAKEIVLDDVNNKSAGWVHFKTT